MTIAFPGYVSDVVGGGSVATDWGNAIRDRTVQVFATVAARDAALPAPQVGQTAFTTDTGSLWHYMGATDGWRPPWNMPWGEMAAPGAVTTTTYTTITDITGMTVAFTAVANRIYLLRAYSPASRSTVANDVNQLGIYKSDNTALQVEPALMTAASGNCLHVVEHRLTGVAAGAVTYKCRGTRNSGTGTNSVQSAATIVPYLSAHDIGPNGNPS